MISEDDRITYWRTLGSRLRVAHYDGSNTVPSVVVVHQWPRRHKGKGLYDRFRELSDETFLGHVVYSDENAKVWEDDPLIKHDIVSYSLLRDFQPDVIFVEGGCSPTIRVFGRSQKTSLWRCVRRALC
jgi:hypothetical protein